MANFFKSCCTPIFAELLAVRPLALTIAVAGAVQLGASTLGFGMPCAFHQMTGLPCPGCGLTRSVLALLHGHVKDSFLLQPFGPVLMVGLCMSLATVVMPLPLRQRFIRAVASVESRTGLTMWVLMLLMILWGVRLTGVLPLYAI